MAQMRLSRAATPASPSQQDPGLSSCPCCGSIIGTTLAGSPALLAVADVLVVRALEVVGKQIVRDERHRYPAFRGRPWHIAHTVWAPNPVKMEKALAGAWDVVPAMLSSHGCCGVTPQQVTIMLDKYVRDLLITGTAHNLDDLRYRFEEYLGIPLIPPAEPYDP